MLSRNLVLAVVVAMIMIAVITMLAVFIMPIRLCMPMLAVAGFGSGKYMSTSGMVLAQLQLVSRIKCEKECH